MRVGRAFSSSARQASQPFFPETYKEKVSGTDKTFLKHRKRLAYKLNPFIPKEASVIHNVFRCSYLGLQGVRNEFASRVAAALAPLHEHPQAFRVKNTSFDRLLGPPTISFASELSLIDLHNPLGISPDTPKSEIPRIYDPSLVAQALSKAGFTGSFYAVDRLKPMTPGASYGVNRPWPDYKHRPLGGFVYPPRLHLDGGQKLGCVTLTLPGPTVMPLFNLFRMFADKNRHFKRIMELVTIWARSHDLHLNTQTIALMVVATMQTEVRPISQWGEKRGWANVDHVSDGRWHQAIHPVDVDFATKELLALPACSIETDILSFFRHWLDLGPSSMDAAFTVRHGRADQHIPRPYIHTWPQLSDFECSLSEIEDPAENFNRWHYSRLVIQDPFLTTHNHAEELPDSEVIRLVHQIKRTNDRLYAGRPLVSMFGPHAAPPGSPAETTILGNTVAYSAALPLLQKQSIPEDLVYEHDTAPIDLRRTSSRLTSRRRPEFDPSSRRRPEFEPRFESGSPDFRRRFHTTGTVSLAKKLKPPVSPKPHSPTEGKKLNPPVSPKSRFPAGEKKLNLHIPRFPTAREPERDEEGWGLNPVPVHEPSFWRPGRQPLKLPARDGATRPIPPVRPTKAGVAYKRDTSQPKAFHTSAVAFEWEARRNLPNDVDSSVHSSRRTTLYKVQSAIRQKYGKKYSVELFGSTRYGISSASSDLDMVVLDPDRPHGYAPGAIEPTTPIYQIRKVARVLYKAGFKIIDSIPQASVPIVIFEDTRTGHSCDLNINDRLGLLNSDLIKRYCELNPVLTDMLKYIKKWAKPLGLNSPSADKKGPITFSSYALVMMTIGFLQHRGLLPNLQEGLPPLEPGTLDGTFWLHKPRIIRCDARYNRAEDWSPPEYVPVHELMRDWFKFWGGEFNFEEETISIRHGGRILRSSLEEGAEYRGILWNIDPFIQSKNLTQNLTSLSLSRFASHCRSYAMLPDFERGDLPPFPSKKGGQAPRPPKLPKPPKVKSDAEKPLEKIVLAAWNPVKEDEFSLWREVPRRRIPDESDAVKLPAEPLRSDRRQEAGEMPDESDALKLPSSSNPRRQKPDYDPAAIRLDVYGRLMAPEKLPPRMTTSDEDEPELDEINWGLKR